MKHDYLAPEPTEESRVPVLDRSSLEVGGEVGLNEACSDGLPLVNGVPGGIEVCAGQEGAKRILLLGINLSTEVWLAHSLSDLGFTLHSIPAAGGGVNLRGGNRINGILWDLEASSLKGFAMVSQLRRKIPGIPVMVLANPSNKKRIIESLEQGAMDYLTKPIALKELKNKCVRLFG